MTDPTSVFFGATGDHEHELMRSPLAAQLCVVERRIQAMMVEQGVRHPRDLVASTAMPPAGRPTQSSA